MNLPTSIAIESGHWYSSSGIPTYSIVGANGKERPTTLRDARKLNLLPSVTEIIKCAAKPGLENWKQNQVMLAALTLSRIAGESDEAFCARVLADSREQGKKAAERGSALHGAIELRLQNRPFQAEWSPHVQAVLEACAAHNIDLLSGEAERSFGCAEGYGGKVDWHSREQFIVLDFKSKAVIDDKVTAYDEHAMQLAAYANGLGLGACRMVNVFVGVDDQKVKIHEWPEGSYERGLKMFSALLTYWQTSKNYVPEAA